MSGQPDNSSAIGGEDGETIQSVAEAIDDEIGGGVRAILGLDTNAVHCGPRGALELAK